MPMEDKGRVVQITPKTPTETVRTALVILAALMVAIAGAVAVWPSDAEAATSSALPVVLTPTPTPLPPPVAVPPVAPQPETPDYVQLQADLDVAIEQWRSNPDTENYSMNTTVSCFCPPESLENTTTVVNGQASFSNPNANGYTVESLFESIGRAIAAEPFILRVSYDANGVPVSFYEGEDPTVIADAFFGVSVSEFEFGSGIDYVQLQADLDAAIEQWESNPDTENYSMNTTVTCLCPRELLDNTTTVNNGQASFSNPNTYAYGYTVESLFESIGRAIAEEPSILRVSYDANGVPIEFLRGEDPAIIADAFFGVLVSEFEFGSGIDYVQLQADLDAAIEQWRSNPDIENYSMTTTVSCFCPPESLENTTTVVNGQASFSNPNANGYTVESLFEAVQTAIDGRYSTIEVTYGDPGIPTDVYWEVGPVGPAVDDFFGIVVDSFGFDSIVIPPEPPVAPIELVYTESFENGNDGWTVGIDKSQARTGQFGVGEPEQTFSPRGRVVVQPGGASDGRQAMVTDHRAGRSVGTYDIDAGYVQAVSPGIEIPANAKLSIDWYWGHASRWDGGDSLSITVESGATVLPVVELVDTGVRAGQWETANADLSQFAGRSVIIRVVSSDVGTGSLVEAGVDNIVITAGPELGGSATTIWTEDFESATNVSVSGNATTGTWNVGAPEATSWSGQALQQGQASSGTRALITDTRAGGRTGAFDVDKGETIAIIEDIEIPINIAPAEYTLSFDWYLAHLDNARAADGLTVKIIGENEELVALNERGTATYQSNRWQAASTDITRFQGESISIVITATDDAALGALIEAGIDNMMITTRNLDIPVLPPVACDTTGWILHEASRFQMLLPPGTEDLNAQGIDSEVGLFTDGVVDISYDLGWYSNSLSSLDDEIRPVLTNGVAGTVRFEEGQPNQLGVYYSNLDPAVVSPPNGQFTPATALNVVVSWDRLPNRSVAECIIGSITLR